MPRYDGSPTRAEKKAARHAERRGAIKARVSKSYEDMDWVERGEYMKTQDRGKNYRRGLAPLTPHQQQLMREAEAFASHHYDLFPLHGGLTVDQYHEQKEAKGNALLLKMLKAGIPPVVIATTPTAAHHEMKLLTYLGPIGSNMRDTREADPRKGLELMSRTEREIAARMAEFERAEAVRKVESAKEAVRIRGLVDHLTPADRAFITKHREDFEAWFDNYGDGEMSEPSEVRQFRRISKKIGLDAEEVHGSLFHNPGRRRHRRARSGRWA